MRRNTWFQSAALALVAATTIANGVGRAQDAQVPPAPEQQAAPDTTKGVARISLINGEVNVRRGDSGDWVAAVANAPLMVEDHIATGAGSRAEVQFDYANFLRLGATAEAQFAQLEANRYQIQVARGTVDFSVLRATNADIEIDTPSISVRPKQHGNYRITVLDNGESEITVRSGQTDIYTPRGVETLGAGQSMLVRGDPSSPEYQIVAAIAPDDWDRWNADRDRRLETAGNNVYNRYVSPDVYGAQDMEGYGRWVNTPDYGNVWSPAQTAGWAPYQNGRWVWEDYYGWTWVSADPWGWAPYHYGRWFMSPGYGWCWWPGSIRSHYWWSPAYVGFFGFGGGGFGVGFGFGNVGWVPLAPFERFNPWWGRGFGGGFGRGGFVNNFNVYNGYRNARFANGVTAVNSRDFAAGRFNSRVSAGANELRSAGMVQGRLGITPTAQNLRFSDRAVNHVPQASSNQRFFTHNQVNTGQRTPFSQQQRSFGGNAGTSGSYRQGTSQGITGGTRSQPTNPSGGGSGWHRFGEPGGSSAQSNGTNRGSTPSNGSSGWNRFGTPGANSGPRSNYSNPGGNSSGRIPVAPPSMRERSPQSNTPQYNRPNTPQYSRPSTPQYSRPSTPQYSRPSTPQYSRPSTPQYSRPSTPQYSRPSTPQYSRPSAPQYSRPSAPSRSPSPSYGGGGHSSGGSSGGHSSSSHGGHR